MSEGETPKLTPAYRLFHLYYSCMIPAPTLTRNNNA